MGRKALIVGIDYYENVNNLHGCVNDAYAVKSAIERHGNGTINFGVELETATGMDNQITRRDLKTKVEELFKDKHEIALFYFSGHGFVESTGGYLATSEIEHGDDGLSMNDLITIANNSQSLNKIIILDCCHSGALGNLNNKGDSVSLSQGLTILTASSATQYASEVNGSGVFTNLLVDALNGGAANLLGHITPGSIYAHIDQSLGEWKQRPIFKTNVENFTKLKEVQATIELEDIHRIIDFFPEKGTAFQLDPSYEPKSDCPNEDNNEVFSVLQKFNRVNLVIPSNETHMYFAAMNNDTCRLTLLGQHYWNLVEEKLI